MLSQPGLFFVALALGFVRTIPLHAIEPFTEEALQRGINYSAAYLPPDVVGMAGGSHGACFADLDQDGDPDLVLVGRSTSIPGEGTVGVYENDGTGHFTKRANTGMPIQIKASSVTAGDYDADGDLDIFLPQIVYPNGLSAPHYFMRNDGGFHFTDVAAPAGILPGGSTTGTAWGDYDGDGYLDLYVVNYSWVDSPINNRLYHNRGNGTFDEVAAGLGVHDPGGYGFQASFVDYDLDGDVDLVVANDRVGLQIPSGNPPNPDNRLFQNLGNGAFQDVSASSGIGTNPPGTMFSMGIAIGDLDRNGWTDFYISNLGFNSSAQNRLHLAQTGNCGVPWFCENAVAYGMGILSVSWGVQFFDLDNDGWLDLYVANTPLGGTGSPAPQLYHFTGTPPAVDLGPTMGLDQLGGSYGVTTADIDNDGDMDLVVVRPYDRVLLYVNHADPAKKWLKVQLKGAGNNHFAVGATVLVHDGLGWQQRAVVAGNSYKSQEDMVRHFGVGSTSVLDEVRVLWPDGTLKVLTNVSTNQTLVICQMDIPPAAPSAPLPATGSMDVPLVTNLNWMGATDVTYRVYFGASSPPPLAVTTNQTTWSPAALSGQTTYYWRVESVSAGCGATLGPLWSFTTVATVPAGNVTVAITDPTDEDAFTAAAPVITLAGTANSQTGISTVTWSNDRGGSGTCLGTTAWSAADIPLLQGDNVIMVTAADGLGDFGSDQLTVTYSLTPPVEPGPVVSITTPTLDRAWLTDQGLLTIAGTASEGTVSVSWMNSRGGDGPCNGTTSWSAGGIALQAGENEITVTARTSTGQSGSAALTVTYRESVPPVVMITEPTMLSRFETSASQLRVAGTASDDVAVAQVTWMLVQDSMLAAPAAAGVASGTAAWYVDGIELPPGESEITVTARDAAGNEATAGLTVVRLDSTGSSTTPPGGPNAEDPNTSDPSGSSAADSNDDAGSDGSQIGDASHVDSNNRIRRVTRQPCGLGMLSALAALLALRIAPGPRPRASR